MNSKLLNLVAISVRQVYCHQNEKTPQLSRAFSESVSVLAGRPNQRLNALSPLLHLKVNILSDSLTCMAVTGVSAGISVSITSSLGRIWDELRRTGNSAGAVRNQILNRRNSSERASRKGSKGLETALRAFFSLNNLN